MWAKLDRTDLDLHKEGEIGNFASMLSFDSFDSFVFGQRTTSRRGQLCHLVVTLKWLLPLCSRTRLIIEFFWTGSGSFYNLESFVLMGGGATFSNIWKTTQIVAISQEETGLDDQEQPRNHQDLDLPLARTLSNSRVSLKSPWTDKRSFFKLDWSLQLITRTKKKPPGGKFYGQTTRGTEEHCSTVKHGGGSRTLNHQMFESWIWVLQQDNDPQTHITHCWVTLSLHLDTISNLSNIVYQFSQEAWSNIQPEFYQRFVNGYQKHQVKYY